MRNILGFVVLGGLLALASGDSATGTEPTQKDEVTFPSKVELVTVDAVVLDAKGKPVPGLTRDDFVVSEDGHPREIARFEAFALNPEAENEEESHPSLPLVNNTVLPHKTGRAFALIVDDLRIQRQETSFTRKAVAGFLDRALVDGDEVTLGSTSGKIWWSAQIPDGREDLLKVLDRIQGTFIDPATREHMTEFEAFWINNYEMGQGADQYGAGNLYENTSNPGKLLQRVELRYLALNLCGDPDHQGLTNCPAMVQADAAAIDGARRDRSRLTLLGIKRALQGLSLVQGRTSLILFSPGFLLDNDLKQAEVTTMARDSHTAVYFVDVRGLITDSGIESAQVEGTNSGIAIDPSTSARVEFEERTQESAGAETLAEDTGGFTVKGTNDLESGARRIADESRVFYLLGFYPAPGKSPKDWHKLKIDVKGAGLKVRARKGYTLRPILAEQDRPSTKVAKASKADAASGKKQVAKIEPSLSVAASLESAHVSSAIPLRAMTYILDPRPSGLTHVLVDVEIDTSKLTYEQRGDRRVAHLEASVAAQHRDSGRGFLHDETLEFPQPSAEKAAWRSFVREFELPAGVSQTRVVVKDLATGALGSLLQRFEVPEPGTLRLATPILTDQIEPAKDANSRPTPALVVRRTFLPLGGLYCEFEVLGASRDSATGERRVAAGLELRNADGHIVNKVDPSLISPDADGRIVRLMGMPLEGMAEGSYDLVLQIQDQVANSHFEDRERFNLSRSVTP